MIDRINIAGKTHPASSPLWRSSPACWVIAPTIPGPAAPPISPAMARSANMAVPPAGIFCDEILMVPGHMMPTENPQMTHPSSPTIGDCDVDAAM